MSDVKCKLCKNDFKDIDYMYRSPYDWFYSCFKCKSTIKWKILNFIFNRYHGYRNFKINKK